MIFFFFFRILGNVYDVIATGIGKNTYSLNVGQSLILDNDGSWYFIRDEKTKYSKAMIKNITAHNTNTFVAYGRFSCIQNLNFQFESNDFTNCNFIPIFKSGVLVEESVFQQIPDIRNVSHSILISIFSKSKITELMNFHYFDLDHKTRGNDFLASFWSTQKCTLDQEFMHAAGLKLDYHITKHAVANYIIGKGLFFHKKIITEYPEISLKCGNTSLLVESTNEHIFSVENIININCVSR